MFDEAASDTTMGGSITAVGDKVPVVMVTDSMLDEAASNTTMDVSVTAVVDTVPVEMMIDSLVITPALSPTVGMEATVGVLGMVDVVLVVVVSALAVD